MMDELLDTNLEGTPIDKLNLYSQNQNQNQNQSQNYNFNNMNGNNNNKELINSITQNLLNKLKENNMSLHDNSSINTQNKEDDDREDDALDTNIIEDFYKDSGQNKYKNIIKKNVETMLTENGIPLSNGVFSNMLSMIDIKDFFLLFGIYFLLSQDMIKELFSQYFTSLNPDDFGRINVKGVIIYGLILTTLYIISKKIII